jgi:hypothetical protein
MDKIWTMHVNYKKYSDKGINLFESMIDDARTEFLMEFNHELAKHPLDSGLFPSVRFKSNTSILWALQSNVSEEKFTEHPKHYLFRVLLGACDADYWYAYENMY